MPPLKLTHTGADENETNKSKTIIQLCGENGKKITSLSASQCALWWCRELLIGHRDDWAWLPTVTPTPVKGPWWNSIKPYRALAGGATRFRSRTPLTRTCIKNTYDVWDGKWRRYVYPVLCTMIQNGDFIKWLLSMWCGERIDRL